MKEINLSQYGPIISSKTIGAEIYNLIKVELLTENQVIVNLEKVKSMATFCAKQIFGQLYIELGSEQFFDRIAFKGADDDLKTIIKIGIQHALEDKE